MAGAKGLRVYFDAAEIAGEDGRVWQREGSANSTEGVVFTLTGEAIKAPGIATLQRLVDGDGVALLTAPIMSIATFHHHGITDIVFNSGSSVYVLRGTRLIEILSNRTVPTKPSEAHRFIQSGDVLIMVNGQDANMKWDGVKATPLGIAATPPAPAIVMDDDNNLPEQGALAAGTEKAYDDNMFWTNQAIEGSGAQQRFWYRLTWVNDKGQESEAGTQSTALVVPADPYVAGKYFNILVSNLETDAPSDDIVDRNLYRSTDGVTYNFLKRLTGTMTNNYWDSTAVGTESSDTLSLVGTNLPPPIAKWGFPFRSRVYYGGNEDTASVLYYSRKENGREAVSASNFIDVDSHDGDILTGWALSQDYALIFKRRSVFMLTHDKNETPILTPINRGIGAVCDRASVGFEGKVYFLSENGMYAFDGNAVQPLSSDLTQRVSLLPRQSLEESTMWVDSKTRRIYLSLVRGPGEKNNEIWVLHVDTGAISRLEDYQVMCATQYEGRTLVGYTVTEGGTEYYDIGIFAARDELGNGNYVAGRFETRWINFDAPGAEKLFERIELYYVQQGSYNMTVDWALDWDDRKNYSATAVPMAPSDATLWGDGNWDNSTASDGFPTRQWDEKRVRTVRIDLTSSGQGVEARGRCIRIGMQTAAAAQPWRIVGMLIHYSDLGLRSEGIDANNA